MLAIEDDLVLDIAEAKAQLARISDTLRAPVLLIGGLAVNNHVPTRNSQDIDIVCEFDVAQEIVRVLYPTNDWKIIEKNEDDYRPAFEVRNKLKADYPVIKFGPKIVERQNYPMLSWDSFKSNAKPFKHKKGVLDKILVPEPAALVYTKILSVVGRGIAEEKKITQDFWDIKELANISDFSVVTLHDMIRKQVGPKVDELLVDFHDRIARFGCQFEGCVLTLIARFFTPIGQNPTAASERKRVGKTEQWSAPLRLVAFDLDGTLIKGIRHSWTLLWNHICPKETQQVERKEQFQKNQLSYAEWCRLDGDLLRLKGLTRQHFKEIIAKGGFSPTKNLVKAVQILRANGFKTAIISGGMDTLLYGLIPNADELFDDVFINRLVFDEHGVFQFISPTEYDWDDGKVGVVGKKRGLERLCEKYSIPMANAAFVGDDHNDLEAMEAAGTKIFYCNDSRGKFEQGLPRGIVTITENDLLRVAKQLINPVPSPL